MSPPAGSGKYKESGTARLLGSGASGILELFTFHPVDTVAKRLMSNTDKIFGGGQPVSQSLGKLNQVIFRDAAGKATVSKYLSLFPGLGYAAGYKVAQRMYKFGGQPVARDFLEHHYGQAFTRLFGERNGKAMMHATAGSLIGIGEVALLPLDVLKIKRQTNPEAFRGRGLLKIVSDEGMALYRGAGWTMLRNAPGSFALFGGSAFVKEFVFGLDNYNHATFMQNFFASIGGAVASLTVSAPMDVIKTRIQARSFDSPESGMTILRRMVQQEGVSSFFKGLTPKILVVGPKLVFGFTLAQFFIPTIDRMLKGTHS
ncbi:high copy suppressor of abf2 [Coemansia sp. RSA 2711]|nr:high copy suppressor of abf2 [Coemansia sp. RSA 2711]KAJ1845836.1 high copy suppressor of abf2 [Coemansia sp. RSA 2708]KAJ2309827.1 high copy suppressor of abf2 [Coemansia sp. RSA 2704]KAJ2310980.1 high copy suppressor of abf2 [Coemansia sp. RSA 2705]KAJ2325768.1 high copy suppressor of abf2 [Coemansia sp. RSA 2702]KAJ2365118.1 high copy suppressor of abf2 [Coemansia sp. RSA 2610]KAJ2386832.1 high copy suppressor of abf2 [Coemansia sp. RSA 2611]KAJ2731398.1 high copy suppressor of abf2 [C